MKKLSYSLLIFIAANVQAQNPSSHTVSLEDMSSFKPTSGNWFIVGKVTVDRRLEEPDPESPSAIKEDRRTQTLSTDHTDLQPIRFENGKGILLNLPSKDKHDQLVTVWEHGDIELELELMIPKGANSGIYMQGGYEIEILDSWGVNKISAEGMGGIYRNWETEAEKMYLGKPPLANASKAPGLWQKLKIVFKAPRFNSKGEKTRIGLRQDLLIASLMKYMNYNMEYYI